MFPLLTHMAIILQNIIINIHTHGDKHRLELKVHLQEAQGASGDPLQEHCDVMCAFRIALDCIPG